MNQAYQHINPGCTHYEKIRKCLITLIERWNAVHIKTPANPDTVSSEFKSVIRYNKNITAEDVQPTIEAGMMGKYGENWTLDAQTFYRWFNGYQKEKFSGNLKNHAAYRYEEPEESEEDKHRKREATRSALIEEFMKYYNDFQQNGKIDPGLKRYYPIFWTWLKKLGLIDITEAEENRMNEAEAKHLRDFREKLLCAELGQTKYKIFEKVFKNLEGLDIESQLKSLEL